MSKKTIIIVLSAIVAAATAVIELLSSCSAGTMFHRVTPADSVYYERHVDVRPGFLSRVFPFVQLHHNQCVEFHSSRTDETTFHGFTSMAQSCRNNDCFVYLNGMQNSPLKRQKTERSVAFALAR